MAIIRKDSQPFEPYARLMNIIGDQLITDKKVAIIEILKNSYDADAENVSVRFFNFKNFGHNYLEDEEQPYIEIEDDGDGMTLDTIRNVWLRPATPNKFDKKKGSKQNRTARGRIIQGEKGIGRFAIHKIGEKIELYTKAIDNNEIKLDMDFTDYDPEKADLFSQPKMEYKLLNSVNNNWYENDPPEEIVGLKGTLIRISNLRERWNEADFRELYKSVQRLIPPVDDNALDLGIEFKQDFMISLFIDNNLFVSSEITTFKDVIERAQFTIIGKVSREGLLNFKYTSTSPKRNLEIKDLNLLSKEELAKHNYTSTSIQRWFSVNERVPSCGPFIFTFYAFDLSKPDRNILNKDIEKFIKDNFVFVLRDGVRVYPYGEKGVDWLNLDKLRATIKAGQFISYNDLTGFVYITQEQNSLLKDSTNRQGIMDIDGALEDFKNLITAVTEIFNTEIKIDKNKLELHKKVLLKDSNDIVTKSFDSLVKILEKTNNREILEKANSFLSNVKKQNVILRDRMETVEDLAGLGMAVEKASHDALTILSRMRNNILDFKIKAVNDNYEKHDLLALMNELDENLNFVYDEMQVIQPMFKAQRKNVQDISISECVEKVVKYFRREIDNKIKVEIHKSDDIIIRTNKGLILQVLINLFDNAIYWTNKTENLDKKIIIKLDSFNKTLTIGDNGPGVREDVGSVIFNEFFSMKTEGRGLGLYIVREILLRINGEISLLQHPKDKISEGANFFVKFNPE